MSNFEVRAGVAATLRFTTQSTSVDWNVNCELDEQTGRECDVTILCY